MNDDNYILEEIEVLIAEEEAILEFGAFGKYALTAVVFGPIGVLALAILRKSTSVKKRKQQIIKIENKLKEAKTPNTQGKYKLKLAKLKVKLEKSISIAKEEKSKYFKRVEVAKHKLAQFKPPLSEKDKIKMEKIKKDLASAQSIISKATT